MPNKKSVPFGSSKKYIKNIQKKQQHEYAMLGRYHSDLDYYFGHGNRDAKHALYFHDYKKHIDEMQKQFDKLIIKPTWLLQENIEEYKNRVDYKWYVFRGFDHFNQKTIYMCTDGDHISEWYDTFEEAVDDMQNNYLLPTTYEKLPSNTRS